MMIGQKASQLGWCLIMMRVYLTEPIDLSYLSMKIVIYVITICYVNVDFDKKSPIFMATIDMYNKISDYVDKNCFCC